MAIKMKCIQDNPIKTEVYCVLLDIIACRDVCARGRKTKRQNNEMRARRLCEAESEFEALLPVILQPKLQILEQLFLPRDVTSTPGLRQIIL